MLFGSESMPKLDFCVSSCSRWGCVEQCIVALQGLLCGIISIPRGTILCLRGINIFPYFCRSYFPHHRKARYGSIVIWGDSCKMFFLSMWSLLWSSIRLHVFLEGNYSFQVLFSHEWWQISWTRILVFHHGLAFSNMIFYLVSFWVNLCLFPLSTILRVLLTLSQCYLSILLFSYVLLVAIFVNICWCYFSGNGGTAYLIRSLGLFWVFLSILMMSSVWVRFFHDFQFFSFPFPGSAKPQKFVI